MEEKRSPYTLSAAIRRQRWYLGALAAVLLALLVAYFFDPRWGGILLACECLVLAVLRWAITPLELGGLVVRRRNFDVAILVFLGIGIGILAIITPNLSE